MYSYCTCNESDKHKTGSYRRVYHIDGVCNNCQHYVVFLTEDVEGCKVSYKLNEMIKDSNE